jgi:hypothetical protein
MLPPSTLPVSPFLDSSAMGLLIGVLAVGGLVALVAGWVLHHREQRRAPRIDVDDDADTTPRTRLSA